MILTNPFPEYQTPTRFY